MCVAIGEWIVLRSIVVFLICLVRFSFYQVILLIVDNVIISFISYLNMYLDKCLTLF
jgi:hypothetical protein